MFNIKKGKEEDINEEEKKVAEKLKELREAADEPETEQPDYSMYSPVEQLSTDKDAGSYHSSRGISTCLQLQGTWRTGHAEVEAQRLGKIRKENLWQKTTGTITARSLLRSWNILVFLT